MKKISISVLLSIFLLLTGSCDSFLDIQPIGKVIPTTATEFRALLTEAYVTVPNDRGLASFRSDEMLLDGSINPNDLNSYLDIWLWNDYAASENTASFKWRQFYHVLFIANYVIESESIITDGTADEIRQMVGESYMLRAMMHFILANLHGPAYTKCDPATAKAVPLKLDSDTENMLSRNTVAEVYASIVSDLDKASEYINVESWETGYNYRFNVASVDAMRSRVYLYMGEWDKSLKASRAVLAVNNQLADIATVLPNEYISPENIVALEKVMSPSYARGMKVDRDFYGLYNSNDLRRSAYYKRVTTSNIQLIKGGEDKFSCSFRVGEIYLNAAEAALELNDMDAARQYLLDLQRARYNDRGYAAKESAVGDMDRDALRTEIYDERARELAFEGHRWFDLRRTTQPRLERDYKGETYVLEQGDERYTIRIPAEAIEANPGLAN
ncbi:MAG: RagB/SusD family nutrient uptake outer membrane protein [Pseudoflavonifractor sp.]|nr:RagB/SusD family nutrient uptake outer membrane protein [Pseudoflavonifractor sp.]